MPDTDEAERHEHHVDEIPILVKVASEPAVETSPADKSSWTTWQLKGDGSTQLMRLLALQPKRHKAQILAYGTAGDFITVGRANQRANGTGGRIMVNSGPIPIESQSDIYITAYSSVSTNDIFVTVIEELYT